MAVKDLNGRSFGSLKVIEFAGLSEKGKALWKCQCECGNVKTILGGDLTSGNTKTCGCSARKDLTGKKYRKLTVLEFSHVSKQQRFWKCRCDCGAIVHVTTRDLVSNNTKSCGCLKTDVIDLTGQRFGRWTVINRHRTDKKGSAYWNCQCDCGTKRIVRGNNLTGGSLSCGCFARERASELGKLKATHGMSGTPIYILWKSIRQRCYNKNHCEYKHYGGRGITVCDRWLNSFENFMADLGNSVPEGMTLDRIDFNGNYSPDNCRWADMVTQCNNTRRNIRFSFKGRTLTLAQWARELGIKYHSLYERFHQGWSVEEAFTTPVTSSNRIKMIRRKKRGLIL